MASSISNSAGVETPPPSPKVRPLDWPRQAELVEPVLAEIEHQVKLKKRQRARRTASVAAAALILGLLWGVPYYRETGTVETIAANRQTLTLADGSRAELNARTQLK